MFCHGLPDSHPSHLRRPEAELAQVDDEADALNHLIVDLGLEGIELVAQA